ncbi:internal scaffolding protein [Microviridae sp.]|nr:internal scaffolding protein [Microviridae sp.]
MSKRQKIYRNGTESDISQKIQFTEKTLTQQQYKEQADINFIMQKYGEQAVLQHYSQFEGDYSEFTDDFDYQTVRNKLLDADAMFLSLPSNIRQKFNNNPKKFLDFVQDEDNLEELYTLGLKKRPTTNTEPVVTSTGNGASSEVIGEVTTGNQAHNPRTPQDSHDA